MLAYVSLPLIVRNALLLHRKAWVALGISSKAQTNRPTTERLNTKGFGNVILATHRDP